MIEVRVCLWFAVLFLVGLELLCLFIFRLNIEVEGLSDGELQELIDAVLSSVLTFELIFSYCLPVNEV